MCWADFSSCVQTCWTNCRPLWGVRPRCAARPFQEAFPPGFCCFPLRPAQSCPADTRMDHPILFSTLFALAPVSAYALAPSVPADLPAVVLVATTMLAVHLARRVHSLTGPGSYRLWLTL